jgi:hypothetical protein
MTTWTKTTTSSRIIYDNGAGHRYVVHTDCLTAEGVDHWHAEESFPWDQDAAGRATVGGITSWWEEYVVGLGDTIA